MTLAFAALLGLVCGLPFRRGRGRSLGALLGAVAAAGAAWGCGDTGPPWLGAAALLGGIAGFVGPARGPGWRPRWPGGAADPVAGARW
jgi:uncharacterized membrane protein YccC